MIVTRAECSQAQLMKDRRKPVVMDRLNTLAPSFRNFAGLDSIMMQIPKCGDFCISSLPFSTCALADLNRDGWPLSTPDCLVTASVLAWDREITASSLSTRPRQSSLAQTISKMPRLCLTFNCPGELQVLQWRDSLFNDEVVILLKLAC